MARIDSTDAALNAHTDPVHDQITSEYSRGVRAYLDGVNDEGLKPYAALHLATAIADGIVKAVESTHTTSGKDRLHSRQPLALGAGTAVSSAEFDSLQGYAQQLKGLPEKKRIGAGILLGRILDGEEDDSGVVYDYDDKGNLVLAAKVADLEVQLADAKRALGAEEKKSKDLDGQLKLALKGTDAEISAAWALLSPAEKLVFKTPILGMLEGTIAVDKDGIIGSHKGLVNTNTKLVEERDRLQRIADSTKDSIEEVDLYPTRTSRKPVSYLILHRAGDHPLNDEAKAEYKVS